MKRNLLLFLLAGWLLTSWAQTPTLLDSIITTHPIFTDDLLGYTRNKYLMNTHWVEKSITEEFDIEKGKGSRDTLVYNAAGQIIFRGRGSYPITSSRPGWKGGNRDSAQYDALGRKIFEKSFSWTQPTSGEGYNYASSGNKYTYIGDGTLVKSKIMGSGQYNVAFGWRGEYTYTYDAQDRVLTETFCRKNATDPNLYDVLTSYKELTYPNATSKTPSLQIYYDRVGDSWVNKSKIERSFDSNNNLLEESFYDWTAGAWVGSSRNLYTYDPITSKLTSSMSYDWDPDASKWQEYSKSESQYSGNVQTSYSYNWNKTEGKFVYSNKSITEVDALGREINSEYYTYSSGAWKGSLKSTKQYLGNDLVKETLKISYSWNNVSLSWVEKEKTVTSYNDRSQPASVNVESFNGVEYEPYKLSTYFYSSPASSIIDLQSTPIKIIASKGSLRFYGMTEGASVQIYSTTGAMLIEKRINASECTISLPAALYLVKVGSHATKVIVP